MKRDTKPCGQTARPASDQLGRCLPFCGLGAEQAVKLKAARCGLGLSTQEPGLPGAAGGADALPQS